jgi:hypothetical protein
LQNFISAKDGGFVRRISMRFVEELMLDFGQERICNETNFFLSKQFFSTKRYQMTEKILFIFFPFSRRQKIAT